MKNINDVKRLLGEVLQSATHHSQKEPYHATSGIRSVTVGRYVAQPTKAAFLEKVKREMERLGLKAAVIALD